MRDRQPLVPAPLRLPAALREYLREEAAGGIVLMAAAAVALAWVNSPWRAAYAALLGDPAGVPARAPDPRHRPAPLGQRGPQVVGVATVAGIGFTVPLFVSGLAFPSGRFDAAVKLGLLLASVVAGTGGALVLLAGGSERRARRP